MNFRYKLMSTMRCMLGGSPERGAYNENLLRSEYIFPITLNTGIIIFKFKLEKLHDYNKGP